MHSPSGSKTIVLTQKGCEAAALSASHAGGLAAKAAAHAQKHVGSSRRGSSLENPVRYGVGACERSLSVGVCCVENGVSGLSRGQSACSSSALPTLPSSEATKRGGEAGKAPPLSHGTRSGSKLQPPQGRRPGSGSPPRGSADCNAGLSHATMALHTSRGHTGRKGLGASFRAGGVLGQASGGTGGSAEPEAEPGSVVSPVQPPPAAAIAAASTAAVASPSALARGRARSPVPGLSSPHACEQEDLGANVEVSKDKMDIKVRLMPSEVIRWSELEVLRPISTGSFGAVFLAKYKDTEVSVKRCIIGPDGSMTKEQLHNLEREINTYRALNHPLIVKYIGCVIEHPNLAIVTEYVPNGNVFDLLYMRRMNLPAAIRLKIAWQVTVAIEYMHSCCPIVIHRDLKTQNLVLDEEYSVRLCDFGKTQMMMSDEQLPLQPDNGGSPRYMAPECFQPNSFLTEKVDIWSLGCCLVEVFGGPLPYEETPQMAQVVNLMLRHRQPPLVPPWFTPEVKPMLSGCFDFNPETRLTSREVCEVLSRVTADDLERHGMDRRRIR